MNVRSSLLVALLLAGVFASIVNVRFGRAEGTIYIRADGSIDPPTAAISTLDNITYTFTDNIYDSIVVERSNIVIDGAGYTLQGSGSGEGFSLYSISNVTIKNTNIKGFFFGVHLNSTSQNIISRNNMSANEWCGIMLSDSSNNSISGNNMTANKEYAINLDRSIDNEISENVMKTYGGLYRIGIRLSDSSNNSISGNDITANDNTGIWLLYSSNNSISGNDITRNNHDGIRLDYSSYNSISRNNITDNKVYGIALIVSPYGNSSGNIVSENNITANGYIGVASCASNSIYHNNIINNVRQAGGASIWDCGYPSGGNYWSDYAGADSNGDGIGDTPYVIDADNQDRYPLMYPWSPLPVHNINTGLGYVAIQEAINALETLDGHAIFVETGTYYEDVTVNKTLSLIGENRDNTIIEREEDYVEGVTVEVVADSVDVRGFTVKAGWIDSVSILLNETSNVLITNNNILGGDQPFVGCGIEVYASTNITLTENNVISTGTGFVLSESSYVSISENNAAPPPSHQFLRNGVGLLKSFDNVVTNNSFTGVGSYGFLLSESSNNTISGNRVTGALGIGIRIGYHPGENVSAYNAFYDNTIENCSYAMLCGFFVGEGGHHDNIFLRNSVKNNYCGVFWYNSSNNIFHHNDFINNTIQVDSEYEYEYTVNSWDDDYPSGGNYWSDYGGSDLRSGLYQNETGSDGIGDAPYMIGSYNSDHYPLTKPYGGPVDLGLGISVSRTVVPFGYNLTVSANVTAINYGIETEISNFTFQMPTISFEQELALDSRNSSMLAFAWNTTNFGMGNYSIASSLEPVSGETDVMDNTYSSWIIITIPGDVNGDQYVNAKDAVLLGKAFGSEEGGPAYNPNLDINDDGFINAKDAVILGRHFGESWT